MTASSSGTPPSGATAPRASDVLGRFVARPKPTEPATEVCDLCSTALGGDHPHLVSLETRRLVCACTPCALLFDYRDARAGRFKRVPREKRRLMDPQLGPDFWERLQIPVRLAFFFENSEEGRSVAFYPGPAGAIESLLPLDEWGEFVSRHPVLRSLEADVEAVLLRDTSGGPECYLVPIDVCYALTGSVRQNWRGFEGGPEAWAAIDGFFEQLRAEAKPVAAEESK